MRGRAFTTVLAPALVLAACGGTVTDDRVVDSVPADVRAYAHADRGADDWREGREALRRLPAIESAVVELLAGVETPQAQEVGLAFGPRGGPRVLAPDDPPVEPPAESLDQLPQYRELLDGLPSERFVHAYASREAVDGIRSLDGSVAAVAAAADLDGDLMRVRGRARHDTAPGRCASGALDDTLLDAADPDAALYLELPSLRCAATTLAARSQGVGEWLERFGRAARRHGNVSLERELLPLLDRRGAFVAVPGQSAPVLTLVVDGINEEEALDVLARLQPAFIHLLGSERLGQAPSFSAAEVEGVTAAIARLAPGLELSYAAWEGKLVVSTALEGIAAMRRAEGLPGTGSFDAVLGDRPESPSALVFLDLDQVLVLGEQAGLAADQRYLAVRDDLQKLRAAGAVLSREDDFTTAELTFEIP